jgi:Protein of unknown function (DUF4238)
MTRPLNHHHQPIFYLTGWCGPQGKVVRYSRPHSKVVASPIAPKSTGYERRLYSLDGYPEDQQQVIEERFFAAVVDEPASRALKVLIAGGDPSKLTRELAEAWTRFLMAARARSPYVVEMMQTQGRRNIEEALLRDPHQYKAVRRAGDPPTLLKLAERICKPRLDNHGKIILPDLIQHPRYAEIILGMNWMTLHLPAVTQPEFLTSDYPCVLTHGGLHDPRCIVAFPLHPRSAFFATSDSESKRGLLSLDAGTIVEQLNDGVVRQAERSVYGRTDAHLSFVESRLRAVKP